MVLWCVCYVFAKFWLGLRKILRPFGDYLDDFLLGFWLRQILGKYISLMEKQAEVGAGLVVWEGRKLEGKEKNLKKIGGVNEELSLVVGVEGCFSIFFYGSAV